MPTVRRTIRLFVSSTFSVMRCERDVLQSDVFPKLRQLCLSNGLRFQPIDLRWGVSEEAGKDNRTMRICLRELTRCQEGRSKPNFLILLGSRCLRTLCSIVLGTDSVPTHWMAQATS